MRKTKELKLELGVGEYPLEENSRSRTREKAHPGQTQNQPT